jgi:hypothetical protein
MTLRLRRGTDLQRQSITFSEGELVYVTDTGELYVGDGSTVGGNLIVGGGGLGSSLTSNLNLSGYEINGNGNIAINGTVSALAIDSGIVSVDSTLIVDNVNSAFYGSFIGDGSLITNISLGDLNDFNLGTLTSGDIISWDGNNWINIPSDGTGIVEGSDYRINIIADNSTTLVNTSTNTLTGNIVADSIAYSGSLNIDNLISGAIGQITLGNTGDVQKLVFERTDAGTTSDQVVGFIQVDQVDDGGTTTYSSMGFWHSGIYIGHSPTGGSLTGSNYVGIQNGGIALGKFSLESGYKLDVTGDAKFRDTVVIENSSLRFNDTRVYTSIGSPIEGEMMWDSATTDGAIYVYQGAQWLRLVAEGLGSGATVLSTFLQLGSSDTSSRDGYGSDSNTIDGAMFYNIDAERIQYYQADSWLNMPNQSLEEDADVRFASVTANTFISTGGGAPTLESETVIDLQAAERVRVTTSPFRLAQLTTTERNAISPVAGDLIYNTTDNRFQGYQNGGWINLDDGTSA